MARPTKYTQELADSICAELALGLSIRTVCDAEEMPSVKTIFNWFRTYPEFLQQYTRAKEESTDAMGEDLLYISDTPQIGEIRTVKPDGSEEVRYEDMLGHRRLQTESRKWLMAKMKPKKYGDKMDVTSDGEKIDPVVIYRPEKIED